MTQNSSTKNQAVVKYFEATHETGLWLSAAFEKAMPTEHAKYKPLFAAGVWELSDPGTWIGRAIVYKLQVDCHVDRLDDGPTAAFPIGAYSGGEMYLPDLSVKLRSVF